MQEIIEIADCRLQYSSELGQKIFDLININKKFRAVETGWGWIKTFQFRGATIKYDQFKVLAFHY